MAIACNKMNSSYLEAFVLSVLVSYVVSSTLPPVTTEQSSSGSSSTAKPSQFYSCLQNCANCVQFWEYGLYNGRRCARRCLHQQGREIVDPDCNNPKMFNYSPRIIDLLLETQRTQQQQQQQQQPASAEEEEMLGDQPSASVRETLHHPRPNRNGLTKRKESSEEVTESFEVEVKAQHVHQGKLNSSKRHHQHRHKGVDGLQLERRRASPSHVARRLIQDGARWNPKILP